MSEGNKFKFIPSDDLEEGEEFRLQWVGPDGEVSESSKLMDPLEVAMTLDDLYVDVLSEVYEVIEKASMLAKVIRSHYDKNLEALENTPLGALLLTDVGLTQLFVSTQSAANVLGLVRKSAIESMTAEVKKTNEERGQRHRPERDRQHSRRRSN